METALLDKARATAGVFFEYRDTFLDEDRVEGYKLLALRGVVVG